MRIQYQTYQWKSFHTSAFHIYFPVGNDSFCSFVAQELPAAMALVKKRMGTSLQKAPNVVIYPSNTGLCESNIGSGELQEVTLPTFILKGNRLLLGYNGSYRALKGDLYLALARSIWEDQLRGGLEAQATDARESIPYWFREGSIRYFAHQWFVDSEDALQRLFQNQSIGSWMEVVAADQSLAGEAFCYYLADQYHKEVPMQLFFQLKKRKPLPRALRLITKTPVDSLYAGCLSFYKRRFGIDIVQRIDSSLKKGKEIYSFRHPKGTIHSLITGSVDHLFTYTLSTWNKRTVYVYDGTTKNSKKILTYNLPPWISDHRTDPYPIASFSEGGKDLLVAIPQKGNIVIKRYTLQGGFIDQYTLEGTDGISSFQPTSTSEFLLVAWRKGQSDIVSYNGQKVRYSPYTNDRYDDRNPQFGDPGKEPSLLFVSNRLQKKESVGKDKGDTLINAHGIYSLRGKMIKPFLIDTIENKRWDKPLLLSDGRLLATNTGTGTERFVLIPNIKQHSEQDQQLLSSFQPIEYQRSNNAIVSYKSDQDSLYVRKQHVDDWLKEQQADRKDTLSPWLSDFRKRAAQRATEDSLLRKAKGEPSFLEGVLSPGDTKGQSDKRKDSVQRSLAYDPKKVAPYVLQLYSAYFTAKVNNDYFVNRYQPYESYQGAFKIPQVGGMAQGVFSDLFENHHFSIAYRLPAGNEGSDFFVRYGNTAKKVDWGLAYFRKVEELKPDPKRAWVDEEGRPYPNLAKVKTHYYEVNVHYPLSYYSSAGFTTAIRKDRTIFLATDRYSLEFPAIEGLWSISTLSYRINKLQPTLPALYKGFSAKLLVDIFKGFTGQEQALTGTQLHLAYHKPLYRYITLVGQLHAGYSGGNGKVLYNLGGVENNITPRVDTTVHFPQEAPYAFQTLVTPFRGYYQNSLYGSKYLLLNVDVYFPIFQTLIPIETPLSSLNNLQLGLFSDLATAGEYSQNVAKNNEWLWAYGLSARSSLAGYPLRFDIGWPGSFSKQPIWYLSLNLL